MFFNRRRDETCGRRIIAINKTTTVVLQERRTFGKHMRCVSDGTGRRDLGWPHRNVSQIVARGLDQNRRAQQRTGRAAPEPRGPTPKQRTYLWLYTL